MERIDIDGPDVDRDESFLLRYRGAYFTGEAVEYRPDGSPWTLTTYVDGFEEGPIRHWFADGRVEIEGEVRRNRAVGEWREWFPDGRLKRADVFDDVGNVLARTQWDENGAIVSHYQQAAETRQERSH